jgi:hypothetical protein
MKVPVKVTDPTSTTVDVVLLGNDFGTLYTAALLAQTGLKCIVLEPANCQPNKILPKSPDLPHAYLQNMSIGHPLRTQLLFENVLRITGSTEQKRVVLRPIGSPSDDFAHTIIKLNHATKKNKKEDVVILRPGEVIHFLLICLLN